MFRASVLALALLVSAPTLWQALGTQTIGVETAVVRFLVTIPIAAVLLALVRAAMAHRPADRGERNHLDGPGRT